METDRPSKEKRLSSSTVRLVRKVVALYLLILGVGLILRAAFGL